MNAACPAPPEETRNAATEERSAANVRHEGYRSFMTMTCLSCLILLELSDAEGLRRRGARYNGCSLTAVVYGLNCGQQLWEDGRTKASDCIPSRPGGVTSTVVRAVAYVPIIGTAIIITTRDVGERLGGFSVHLVQQWVDEPNITLSGPTAVSIDQPNDAWIHQSATNKVIMQTADGQKQGNTITCPNRGRDGRAVKPGVTSIDCDVHVMTKC
jgi:hypothetical protein